MLFDTGYCQEATSFYAFLMKHDYEIAVEGLTGDVKSDNVIFWLNPDTGTWALTREQGSMICVQMQGDNATLKSK